MATVTPTTERLSLVLDRVTWENIVSGDTCTAHRLMKRPYALAVQAAGTFGGATAVVQGSLDETNYADLDDGSGAAISITAATVTDVGVPPFLIRPSTSGGTADSIDVTLLIWHDRP